MEKKYKEPIESEMETTVNVLYGENCLSLYTNKPDVQRKLKFQHIMIAKNYIQISINHYSHGFWKIFAKTR